MLPLQNTHSQSITTIAHPGGYEGRKKEEKSMNILEYINDLIDQGYSEEDAERCANAMFADDFSEDDYE